MHRTKRKVAGDALDANTTIAEANRHDFDHAGVRVVNLMSAPGAGKTTLLEATLPTLDARVGVLEGDVQGSMDSDRIAHLHIPVVQLNTEAGFGGECHLDANMVRSALGDLDLHELDLLATENVGNLRCTPDVRGGGGGAGHDLFGDRGGGQAPQVPAHVPGLRAGRHQQDRPPSSSRL